MERTDETIARSSIHIHEGGILDQAETVDDLQTDWFDRRISIG